MEEIFWKTITDYNQNTWLWQIGIFLIGLGLTVLIYNKPSKAIKNLMKGYLAFTFAWIGIVFFYQYGSVEAKKFLTGSFFLLIALLWIVDIFFNRFTFERTPQYNKPVLLFYLLFLSYPLVSILLGKSFPSISTWLMPCPLTVFALTLICSFSKQVNRFLLLLLVIWALTGLPKIFIFNVPEDVILFLSGVFTLIVFVPQMTRKKSNSVNKSQAS